jgi:hypothetical protein
MHARSQKAKGKGKEGKTTCRFISYETSHSTYKQARGFRSKKVCIAAENIEAIPLHIILGEGNGQRYFAIALKQPCVMCVYKSRHHYFPLYLTGTFRYEVNLLQELPHSL